jgi:hypothetical protein
MEGTELTWQLWIIVGVFAFAGISTVLSVGKERKPTSPEMATAVLILDVVFIALILWGSQ